MYSRFRTPSIWREMDRMQREMNRIFTDYLPVRTRIAPSFPALNLWINEESVIVNAELPGVKAEDLDISLEEGTLTLSGKRITEDLPEEGKAKRQERRYGNFTRNLHLPFKVDQEHVQATLKNGVLKLLLPRAEEDKPKKIIIRTS